MGGGHRYPYPKWVWSPSGGWWHTPKNANRNAVIYVGVCSIISYFVVSYCEPRTVSLLFLWIQQFHYLSRIFLFNSATLISELLFVILLRH